MGSLGVKSSVKVVELLVFRIGEPFRRGFCSDLDGFDIAYMLFMQCPHCESNKTESKGFYFVRWKSKYLKRYRCRDCKRSYSRQTVSEKYRQKKPFLNQLILKLHCSGVSERRTAFILNCSKNTVAQKLRRMAEVSEKRIKTHKFSSNSIQFDEAFSIEHTKLKPLSIAVATNSDHEIVSVQVGRVPASGHLADISKKKYGVRPSEKFQILERLFLDLKERLPSKDLEFTSDEDPMYPQFVKKHFPKSPHKTVCSRSQVLKKKELLYTAEQKKVFDPMFALNHTHATLRDHIKRLSRRNWCTTKKPENLEKALRIYQAFSLGLLDRV